MRFFLDTVLDHPCLGLLLSPKEGARYVLFQSIPNPYGGNGFPEVGQQWEILDSLVVYHTWPPIEETFYKM